MDIFPKIFEKVEFVFHFQTNFDSHIALNIHVKNLYYRKMFLFDIHIHKIVEYYF
jgi:hypothetical protein